MGAVNFLLDKIADRVEEHIQGSRPIQKTSDFLSRADSFSVEVEICEALTNLLLMGASMPVRGDSERARLLDKWSTSFLQSTAAKAINLSFLTGDAIVVPSWNGRNMQAVVCDSRNFEILENFGDEITACAYTVEERDVGSRTFKLSQVVRLEPYETMGGVLYCNHYSVYASCDGHLVNGWEERFPDWAERYNEWLVPNVDRLLIGRMKSFATDYSDVNNPKGAPICYGASSPISEIRYLIDQMHEEYNASEKMIFADKRLFRKRVKGGEIITDLPRGKSRVIENVSMTDSGSEIHEWAPTIRDGSYLSGLDKQERLAERAVSVSSGVISTPNDANYENVDNVRKSQQKTISFISNARTAAERMIGDLVYSWDVLCNYFNVCPMGEWSLAYDWSDEYIETFSDMQNAIIAGNSIGATDALDYRMWLFKESPEIAQERIDRIREQKNAQAVALPVFGE